MSASPASASRRGRCPPLAAEPYTVRVRVRGKVRKRRCSALTEALTEIEREGRELESGVDGSGRGGGLMRRLEPVQIVVARLELSGPRGLRAGVDVRGDGSSEAFTGRMRRRVLEQRGGESPYDALRRELS
jgi:hypothetical protein